MVGGEIMELKKLSIKELVIETFAAAHNAYRLGRKQDPRAIATMKELLSRFADLMQKVEKLTKENTLWYKGIKDMEETVKEYEEMEQQIADLNAFISAVEEKVKLLPEDYVSETIKNMFAERDTSVRSVVRR
jgi:predicted nuclease with TOPRIM domain